MAKYAELTMGQVEAIVNKLGGMEGALSFLRGEKMLHEKRISQNVFPVTIDYGQSLAEMVKAVKCDWTNSDVVAERFPLKGTGVVERSLSLVHFNRSITSVDAIHKMMDEVLKEPAMIEDLLAFGAKYPEEQRMYPIIALGSSTGFYGDHLVPRLGWLGNERRLNLHRFDSSWLSHCRFLARDKVSAT